MRVYRLIAPEWLQKKSPGLSKVLEGQFSDIQIQKYNKQGYNVYVVPNHPKEYVKGPTPIDGTNIDVFEYVFVDMDLKDKVYASKDDFLARLGEINIPPTKVIDSGGGIHAYWKINDLDAMSYLRLSRRFMRLLRTDEKVGQIFQLMRHPGTMNTKIEGQPRPCELAYEDDSIAYTCEELDALLPPINVNDEKNVQQHFDKTYHYDRSNIEISDEIPAKFGKLIHENHEVKDLWAGHNEDRSGADYRLGHIMFANDFTREEAMQVLCNSVKASARAPIHRLTYAENIIDKIWTYEIAGPEGLNLSSSVADLLKKSGNTLKGVPFRCHKRIDNTAHGFRLGQVIGLVAGSGVGKTAFALNMFRWFAQENPDYHHFFIPLEQPANEIADRWKTMCGDDTSLHNKVHVMSNYDDDGNFRHLSLDEIQAYVVKWQLDTGNKIGCIVIDHIGALKKKGAKDENQDLMTICHSMKAFAIKTNTLLVMQSQTSREKAGIGDLELNKDAAYGTLFFESYCDYLITLWQPLKRCHSIESCPTVTAFKFCKIRHKKAKIDVIKEDVPYYFLFDSDTELMEDMNQIAKQSFDYFIKQATNKRKQDRKTELVEYQSVPYQDGGVLNATQINSPGLARRH